MTLRTLSLTATALSLFAFGCSDAPARPAKVGLYVNVRNPDSNVPGIEGRTCPASSGVEWDLGKAVMLNGMVVDVESPSPTDFGTTLENKKSDAQIKCTVRKSGSFVATGGGIDPQITKPNGRITFTFNGTAKPKGTPATNTMTATLYTPVTLGVQTQPAFPQCIVTAVHEQAPGALWADFDCPVLTQTGNPSVACHASGTMVFEYCKTGEEED
jgi:hypothetical protein